MKDKYIEHKNYAKENLMCVIAVAIAVTVSLFNPYTCAVSIYENFWYVAIMFIYFINIKIAERVMARKDNKFIYGRSSLKPETLRGKKVKIFIICSLIILRIVFGIPIFLMTVNKVTTFIIIFKAEFFFENAEIIMALSMILEFIVIIIFSIRVIKEESFWRITDEVVK